MVNFGKTKKLARVFLCQFLFDFFKKKLYNIYRKVKK